MVYFRITSSGEIEKYEVRIDSDGLQEAKDESILNCGKKVRRSFTTTSSCISGKYYLNVTRKYAGIKSYTYGPDVELYTYDFIECEKTYLSTLIDRILNGDLSALVEIYKEDLMVINDRHVKLIMDLLNSKRANSKICLPHNVQVIKSYDEVLFTKEVKETISYEVELIKYALLPNGHKIEVVDDEESNNNDVCRIDSSEVSFPLYVRTRKLGDKMFLKKIDGYKKVKDIFIDCKIPTKDRDKWPIVVDSKDKIIWIPGVKKSKFTKLKNEKYDIILKYS